MTYDRIENKFHNKFYYKKSRTLPNMPEKVSEGVNPYRDFNGITSKFGAHFILRVDKILMKKKYSDAIVGDKSFGEYIKSYFGKESN